MTKKHSLAPRSGRGLGSGAVGEGMKLESIEAILIEIPLTQNFGGSTYSVLKRAPW